AILVFPTISLAQVRADRVPADALVYLSWRGIDDLGPGYDGSHLKAVLDASEVGKLIHEAIPQLGKRLGDQDQTAAQVYDKLANIAGPLLSHPSAFYFGGLDLTDKEHPIPHLALLCDAGKDA